MYYLNNSIRRIMVMSFLAFVFFLPTDAFSITSDNDLVIESTKEILKFDYNSNAVSVRSLDAVLVGKDTLELNLNFQVSWECDSDWHLNCEKPSSGEEINKRAVAFAVKIIAENIDNKESYEIALFPVFEDEVAYRIPSGLEGEHIIRTFDLTSKADFFAWWTNQRLQDKSELQLKIIVDSSDVIVEKDEIDNNIYVSPLSKPFVINGDLYAGNIKTDILSIGTVAPDEQSCGATSGPNSDLINLHINGTTKWIPSSNGKWNDMELSFNACLRYDIVTDDKLLSLYLLNDGSRLEAYSSLNGTLGTLNVEVPYNYTGNGISLDTNGISMYELSVTLPEKHTFHYPVIYNDYSVPNPMGKRKIYMYPSGGAVLTDMNDLLLEYYNGGYLQVRGLPFSLKIGSLNLDKNGLSGKYQSIHYAYDLANVDISALIANDTIFSSSSSVNENFLIRSSGLQTGVDFSVESAKMHFPRISVKPSNKRVEIDQGKIVTANYDTGESWGFEFNPSCPGCTSSGDNNYFNLRNNSPILLDDDGSVVSNVRIDNIPAWGSWSDPHQSRIFERWSDIGKNAWLFIPGYIAQGTDTLELEPVSNYLMGSRELTKLDEDKLLGQHHLLGSEEADVGNHFMAGITVGPQIYSDVNLQPQKELGEDLTGSETRILFGGVESPAPIALVNNMGSKYVIRPEGITGVFNFDESPEVQAYGFNFKLRRFGFRQVDNILDTYSWIDGLVDIPGKGDFRLFFDSLALECSGDLGGGILPRETSCDDGVDNNKNGVIDENCNQDFVAWKTPIELLGMKFDSPEELQECKPKTLQLHLNNTIELAAFNRPIGMDAFWDSLGNITHAKITGDSDVIIDKPSGDGRGFDLALKENFALVTPDSNQSLTDGWASFNGTVGTPFWNALTVSSRVANRTLSSPMQTLIHKEGDYIGESLEDYLNKNNDELALSMKAGGANIFEAKYEWGDTGFGFDLPIYYVSGRLSQNLSPQFNGKMTSYDIPVLNLNSGIDFITPERTKISFGASADFEKLARLNFDLHVDLNDPQSVTRLDSYLCDLSSSLPGCSQDGPITDLVGVVQEPINQLNRYANAGFEKLIEEGIRKVITSIRVNGSDPFELVSEQINQIQSFPDLIASQLSLPLHALANELIIPLSPDIDSRMLEVSADIESDMFAQIIVNISNNVDLTVEESQFLADMDSNLYKMQEALSYIQTLLNDGQNYIDDAKDGFERLKTATLDHSAQLKGLLSQVKTTIRTSIDLSCNFGEDISENEVIASIQYLLLYIKNSNDALREIDIEGFSRVMNQYANIDLDGVVSAKEQIELLTAQLNLHINEVENLLKGSICTDMDFEVLLTDVNIFIDKLNTQLDGLNALMEATQSKLVNPLAGTNIDEFGILQLLELNLKNMGDSIGAVHSAIDDARTYLATLQHNALPSYDFNKAIILATLEDSIKLEFGQTVQWNDHNGKSFVVALKDILRDPIDDAIGKITADTRATIANITLSLPQPTALELKEIIVLKVMNTDVIEDINREVYEHMSEVVDEVNNVYYMAFSQLNYILQEMLVAIEDEANALLENATASMREDIPLASGKVDGYVQIGGNELERLHIDAEWKTLGSEDDDSMTYKAALDVASWSVNGKGDGCDIPDSTTLVDAKISAYGLPLSVGLSDVSIKQLTLGFTLGDGMIPIGYFGDIFLDGIIDFQAFQMYDVGFAAGIGLIENYAGARAGALFEDIQMEAAFLVGKTCNTEVLLNLDPQVGDFIDLPNNSFSGVFVRGSASMPIWYNGCALTVGVSADTGAWILINPPSYTLGGLVGGGGFGKALCIASLKGKITAIGQLSDGEFSFLGEGWGAAGVGSCSPGSWSSVSKSRRDSWCGTGDARFEVVYKGGWEVNDLSTSAVH